MRFQSIFFFALPLLALTLVPVRDAAASGGYFVDLAQQGKSQISSHRMVLSISKTKTTLWDQITYAGEPQSFAWVLPIKGKVEVGVSSNAMLDALEEWTRTLIFSPVIECGLTPDCEGGPSPYDFALGDNPEQVEVSVVDHDILGPYEMVQLSSQDPNALKTWLTDNNYTIPDDINPTISAYVDEGFNFLAIKLLPGQGIRSMKPVRVTTPGANPVLPLRMVAAGAGMTVPITLWVLGEGSYVPSNFPWFTITKEQLVWDWDKKESNYKRVRQDGFMKTSGKGWLIEEASRLIYPGELTSPLLKLALEHPEESGYGDGMSTGPVKACGADIDALLSDIDPEVLTITRLHAELPREALVTDLIVEAASDQGLINSFLKATKTVGKTPTCPIFPPCADVPMTDAGPEVTVNERSAGGGCACSTSGEAEVSTVPFGALLSLGGILACRRKKAGRAISP